MLYFQFQRRRAHHQHDDVRSGPASGSSILPEELPHRQGNDPASGHPHALSGRPDRRESIRAVRILDECDPPRCVLHRAHNAAGRVQLRVIRDQHLSRQVSFLNSILNCRLRFSLVCYLCRYSPLVRNVLTVFRPKRFVLTMFGDQTAVDNLAKLPTDVKSIPLPLYGTYSRTSVSSTVVETDLCCLMACYRLEAPTAVDSVSSPAARQQQAAIRRERGHSLC
jgi:hypothetical protein